MAESRGGEGGGGGAEGGVARVELTQGWQVAGFYGFERGSRAFGCVVYSALGDPCSHFPSQNETPPLMPGKSARPTCCFVSSSMIVLFTAFGRVLAATAATSKHPGWPTKNITAYAPHSNV